jgi:hypothetical protein
MMATIFLAGFFAEVPAQTARPTRTLNHLKPWIGKYPYDPKGTHNRKAAYRNFFALPEIKSRIVRVLKSAGYQKLVKDFGYSFTPVELVEGFLVMVSAGPGDTRFLEASQIERVMVAINLKGDQTHIMRVKGNKYWGNSNTEQELPLSVEERLGRYLPGWRETVR